MKSASLNHIYRLVWNEATNTYVAVAEHIAGRGKRTSGVAGALVAVSLALLAGGAARAQALPTGAAIAAGAATISQSGNQMTITQATQRLVTNWNTFDVGAGASVRFAQPDANAIALNRVTGGGAASAINGGLSANGNVWLLNPNGVVFGSAAQVNVGGLVASSLALSDSDFLAGRTRLTGNAGAGAVVNHGTIRTASGGVVALVAPRVANTGSIATPGGSTALAAGETVSLDFQGDGLVSVRVERGVADAAVENSGRIAAEGGLVTLSARGADAVLGSVVNNTGVIEAHGLVARDGRILLDGDATNGGTTHVAGTLDVTSAGGRGGAIVVTGKAIALDGGALLDASGATGGGTVNVGGGWQGKDAAIANATTVTADAGVTARADATGNGNGGKVVFWSDDANTFAGRLSTRGGAQGGDGGDIEVSGKKELHYSGIADARAPRGLTGNLLLDPTNIVIEGGSGISGNWTTASGDVTIYATTLESQTANVLLQADRYITFNDLNNNGGNGSIVMQRDVSFRAEAMNNLATANPNDRRASIRFTNSDNTLKVSGTGSIYMNGGGGGNGYGTIGDRPDSGSPTITPGTGTFNLIAGDAGDTGVNPAITALPDHNVSTVGSGTPSAGSITLLGADGILVSGNITTHGGYVRISGDSDVGGRGAVNLTRNITTNGGNLYVYFGNAYNAENIATIGGNVRLGAGRLVFGDEVNAATGSRNNLGDSGGEKRISGLLDLSGSVHFTTPLTLLGGARIQTNADITFTNTVTLDTGNSALTLRAADIDFSGATLANVSTASVVLQPHDVATNIDLNGATTGIARASNFTQLAGIRNLTIGRADGTGTTTVPTTGFGFDASNTLTLLNGNIAVNGALTNTSTSGHIVAQAGQDVVLGTAGTVTASGTGDAVVLDAGRNFINGNTSAAAISATNGRWLVYSTTPADDTRGNLVNGFKQYNANYGGTAATDTVLGTGNGFLYSVAPIVSVSLTGEIRKTYDGSTSATATNANLTNTGAIDGDTTTFRLGSGSTASYTTKVAGAGKNVDVNGVVLDTATQGAVQVYGYQWNAVASGTVGVVTQRSLAVNPSNGISATVANKVYDGGTGATVTGVSIANVAQGDVVSATGTGTFIDRNVGTGKGVTVGNLQLSGADAANYTIAPSATANATANITAKTLTATASVADKVYDGGTAAALSGVALVGVINGDQGVVGTTGATGSFIDRNVGAGKSVSGSGIALSGTGAGNYVFDTTAQVGTAAITPKTLTAIANVSDKVYDGGTAAALGGVALVGVVTGDQNVVGTTGTVGRFVDKNVGTGKVVSGSGIALSGTGAGNYTFDTAAQIGTAAITPKTLTATASVADKVYDGNRTAAIGNVAFNGVVAGDSLSNGTGSVGTFDTKNVGTGKSVTGGGIVLAGADAGNYVVDGTTAIGTAAITPKALTATANVSDKVYDGNTAAALGNVALVGVVSGDQGVVGTTGATGSFIDRNVGAGKAVSGSGIALSGSGAGNYTFDTAAQVGTAAITPKTLTATANVADKVYDGGTAAALGGVALVGVVNGDQNVVGTTGATGSFIDRNVGAGKSVSGSGIALSGTGAGNYVFDTAAQIGTAAITPKTLTAIANVSDKVYDGGTAATLGGVALVGVVNGDQGVVGTTGTVGRFTDKNVGTGKSVSGSGIALSGTGAGNYVFDTAAQIGTAAITPKTVTATASVSDKVYDGGTAATIGNIAFGGVVAGDSLSSGTGSVGAFDTKNVGTGKSVTGSGIVLAGADAGNYVVDAATAIGTAAITPKALTATANVSDKVYDGGTAATLGNVALVGLVNGDQNAVGTTGSTGSFADRNVGAGKAVSGSGIALSGSGAGNYAFDTAAQVGTAAITPRTLTATASVADKVYDGNRTAALGNVALVGVVNGDQGVVGTTGSTGSFVDRNAGTGKAVAGSGIALSGSGAGNYVFDAAAQVGTAAITPKTLTATASVADKVYDGNRAATLGNVALVGVVNGDQGIVGATGSTGSFADKNVGAGKVVAGSGIGLSGSGAGNYAFDTAAQVGTAAITPKTVVATVNVADKVYDGNRAAAIGNVAFGGVVAGDSLSSGAGSVGTFDTKNVGTGKSVTGSGIVLAGADAGNYVVDAGRAIGMGAITPKTLTASGTVADKVYDGTTVAQIGGVTLAGVVAGDTGRVTATGTTGRYGDRNVGTGKAVTGSGLGLTGSEAGNYVLDAGAVVGTGRITPRVLSADGANVDDKPYDGTAVATVRGLVLGGVVAGDDVAGNGGVGRFDSPEVGTGKAVAVAALSLAGRDAGNYALDRAVASGRASIVPLRNDASLATALVAPPVGVNGTALLSTRTLEPVVVPVDATAQAALAVLVTGRAGSPAILQAAAVANEAAPTAVQVPLVLTDAVLTSRGRLSLVLDDGVPVAVPLESAVPVYSERSGQVAPKAEGQYAVTDRGTDVSLALVGNATSLAEPVAAASSGARSTEASVLRADGGALALRVTLLGDGTLTVQVPDGAAELGVETVTAYGLATAKNRFGIALRTIKAVIVQYGLRTAGASGGSKVAGL